MKNADKFSKAVSSDKQGLRFATPEAVAGYRARRLRCDTLADINCGIGGQTIFFAKHCRKVFAIDLDPVKIRHARKNCRLYGITNVEFICGDALSAEVINELPRLDVVFSDPSRPPSEAERNVGNLTPSPGKVLEAYRGITRSFAFEVPPQLPPERIPFDCEKEYLSLGGKLNRLNLYFGNLKTCERSAVSLPSGNRLISSGSRTVPGESPSLKQYAFEPDPAVIKANLLPELLDEIPQGTTDIFAVDRKRLLLTSDVRHSHPLFKYSYEVLEIVEKDARLINGRLKHHDAKTALLRGNMDPEHYWDFRNMAEKGLEGRKNLHLFLTGNKAIICRVL
jgi:SAM-dependent methyltransferase